jgi:hypothetical protein
VTVAIVGRLRSEDVVAITPVKEVRHRDAVQGKMLSTLLRRESTRFAILSGFLCAFIYLYLILFVPPRTPIDLSFGDNGLALSEAVRILHGGMIYRDFFDVHFPGTQFLYALLIALAGPRVWIPNASLVCLGIGFLWTSIIISRALLRGATILLPGLMFLCLSFHNYLDPTHHWYSNLLIMTATTVLIERRSRARLALAGGLSGLAAIFSQNHGVLAGLALVAFVWWDTARDGQATRDTLRCEVYFLVPFVMIFGGCIAGAALKAGFANFYSATVMFPVKYWSASADPNSWSDYALIVAIDQLVHHYFHILRPLSLAILIPGIYVVAIIYYIRRAAVLPEPQGRAIVMVSTVGLSLFASIANSASIARLSTVSLPGFIILVWLLDRTSWSGTAKRLLWALTLTLMLRDVTAAWQNRVDYVDTPAGRVALSDTEHYQSYYQWLSRNTRPGEAVFNATNHSGIYFLFGLDDPTRLWWLTSCDYTRPEEIPGVLRGLKEREVRLVLWSSGIDAIGCRPGTDHIQPIRDYLRNHYRRTGTFRDIYGMTIVAWERTADSHEP